MQNATPQNPHLTGMDFGFYNTPRLTALKMNPNGMDSLAPARSALTALRLQGSEPVTSATSRKNSRLRAEEMPQFTGTLW